ncbi:MAG: efflux RND transporter periplasmic adaptor subunit [Chthoniobacterales bacterium]
MTTSLPISVPQKISETAVPPALRADLVQTRQTYIGRTFTVLKNPISLNYFRLPVSHAEAAQLFDGKRTFRQIVTQLQGQSRYWKALPPADALEEVGMLAQQMAAQGLLRVQGGSAVARAKFMKARKKEHHFELLIGKVLYVRKSLIDPDKLLERITPWFAWMFTVPTFIAVLCFIAVTLVGVSQHWDEVMRRSANFFTFENLALSWVLFFGIKIFHEFGHAISCKRFGGEVHEMGFMFILFTPYLFCNVSDSWLASKHARICITAAGIFVELVIACIAAWLWIGSQPGLFHQMCFNAMFLASISTILFNANPLLKFDGYYIMADILEIPNLKQKSNQYITHWAQQAILGIKGVGSRIVGYEQSPWFGVYAVASYIYGWLVLFRISTHLFDALTPVGLNFISRTYVGLFLFTSLALPFYRLVKTLPQNPDFKASVIPRLKILPLIILGLIALTFIIPWQSSVKRTFIIEHEKTITISAEFPGFAREVFVSDGQAVKAGDLLVRLENPDLVDKQNAVNMEIMASDVRRRAALNSVQAEDRNAAPTYEKMVQEFREQLAILKERMQHLEIRAPYSGTIRNPHIKDIINEFFKVGQPICELGLTNTWRALIPLNEHQAKQIAKGERVKIQLYAIPGKTFEGKVTSLPSAASTHFSSPAMANLFGGDVPAELDPQEMARPTVPHYEAEVYFVGLDSYVRPGMMGKARIYTGRTTLGSWMIHQIIDYISPEMRL